MTTQTYFQLYIHCNHDVLRCVSSPQLLVVHIGDTREPYLPSRLTYPMCSMKKPHIMPDVCQMYANGMPDIY